MKRSRDKEQGKKFHGRSSCFYKLFLSPASQSKKLWIPDDFARIFRDELSSTSILKLPTGETWRVRLVKEDDKLYFHDGWQAFVEYCSIQYAYFLLFTYEGKSNFQVDIFDCTGCEISYPCNVHSTSEQQHKTCPPHVHYDDKDDDDDDDGDNDNDNDDDDYECSNVFQSSSVNPKSFDEEVIQLGSDDDRSEIKHSLPVSQNNSNSGEKVVDMDEKEIMDAKEGSSFKLPLRSEKHEELLDAVVAVGISFPKRPYFVTLIRPYVLYRGQFLNIPKSFGHYHLGCKRVTNKQIQLEAHNGKLFSVQCISRRSGCSFGKGWIVFAREVGLEVGDACVFELIDAMNYVLKVHIAKSSQINAAVSHIS